MTTLQDVYQERAPLLAGAPAWGTEEATRYAPYIGKEFAEGTTWEQYKAEVDREKSHLMAQADPRLPVYPIEGLGDWKSFFAPEDIRDRLTKHALGITPDANASGVFEVYSALVARCAWWAGVPESLDEKNADFCFARMRCVLGGAGFSNWKALASAVCDQYPECPFVPDQHEAGWAADNLAAHRTCGWPTTLLWWDWNKVPDAAPSEAGRHMDEWLKPLALAHVLKHVRRSPTGLVLTYAALVETAALPQTSRTVGSSPPFLQAASTVLRASEPKKSAKASALLWAYRRLAADDLLPARPLSDLPGDILTGPWSTALPVPTTGAALFLNPGRALSGVWRAAGGRITPYNGDESDILDWAWNYQDANSVIRADSLASFTSQLPATYPQIRPTTLLRKAFPHWCLPEEGTPDLAAYLAMVDAVLCAGLLRNRSPDLRREFPLVAVLPISPSAEESTNQGKGLLTRAMAGCAVPGIDLLTAPDSGSAPDSRAIADVINRYGTAALDEFQVPTSRSHCLSRDNLQSLCTGGVVSSGKVYENSGEIRLRHSLFVNAKWLDLADDLVNRTLPVFLGPLPDEQRGRTDVKTLLENGTFATLLRLAAVSTIEKYRLDEVVAKGASVGQTTASAWRFTMHRQLAITLVGGEAALIDEACLSQSDDLKRHMQLADESGVSSTSSSGKNIRVSWPAFWAGIDETSLTNIHAAIQLEGENRRGGNKCITLTQLCRYRLQQMGRPDGTAFCALLPALTGSDVRASNTAIVRSLTLQVRAFFGPHLSSADWVPMPGDLAATWECMAAQRAPEGDSPSARSIVFSMRKRGAQ